MLMNPKGNLQISITKEQKTLADKDSIHLVLQTHNLGDIIDGVVYIKLGYRLWTEYFGSYFHLRTQVIDTSATLW